MKYDEKILCKVLLLLQSMTIIKKHDNTTLLALIYIVCFYSKSDSISDFLALIRSSFFTWVVTHSEKRLLLKWNLGRAISKMGVPFKPN